MLSVFEKSLPFLGANIFKWMNARDTLLEALLVNGVVPPVRSDDFLCLLHYLRGGQVLRLPSAVLCLQ